MIASYRGHSSVASVCKRRLSVHERRFVRDESGLPPIAPGIDEMGRFC
jgi:hypothetical protein